MDNNHSYTHLYQMYDNTAGGTAGPIILEKNDATARRAFNSVLQNPQTGPGQYPEDFELRYIGIQNDQTGEITALKPQTIASGKQWSDQQKARQAGQAAAS